ncbi:MAG TPA: hypothetical protein VK832_20740 [Burkholderiaceae bacterium]|jgi:hypothetical protein|nr:hypothetical protein [Burkholderiaceae bacterium]
MTRDECLGAASAAFGGAFAWAKRGYWQIKIETTPLRTLVLSKDFVQKNIFEDEMKAEEFQQLIQGIPSVQWSIDEDGCLLYLMR